MADVRSIHVTLPSDVVYVTGIINDVDCTFTRQEGDVWATDVARTSDDIYRCRITAVASNGNSTTWDTVLYYGLHLITDRTQSDVDQVLELSGKGISRMTASELSEWLEGMKGAYNAADLNRVESAVEYVRDRLALVGVLVYPITKVIWTAEEWPTLSEMERYLTNIRTLRESLPLPIYTPEVPESMDYFTYEEANDIERILEIVDTMISNIIVGSFYSGELYGGEI